MGNGEAGAGAAQREREVQIRVLGVCVCLFQVRINPHFVLATLMVPPHHRSSSGCNFPPTVPYMGKQYYYGAWPGVATDWFKLSI